jgi:hypothetical protein
MFEHRATDRKVEFGVHPRLTPPPIPKRTYRRFERDIVSLVPFAVQGVVANDHEQLMTPGSFDSMPMNRKPEFPMPLDPAAQGPHRPNGVSSAFFPGLLGLRATTSAATGTLFSAAECS